MTNWLIRRFIPRYTDTQDPTVRLGYGRLAGWVGIVCNLLLAGGKAMAGLLSGSISIVADAVNNLSDGASSVVTLVGFKVAAKPADREHPFGHARIEYVAGLVTSFLVLLFGLELARTSIGKILHPEPVTYSLLSFCILGGSILVKLWMSLFYRTAGRRIDSATLQAGAVDSRNDVLTTTVVLVCALVAHFTGLTLDSWAGLAVALLIVWSGVGLIRDTVNPLLGQAPDPEMVRHVAQKIRSYPEVLGTHDLIVHDYGPGRRFASAHVEMDSSVDVMKSHDVIDNIERDFLENDGLYLIIHFDPVVVGDPKTDAARHFAVQAVKSIDPALSLHDFRMVDGPTHTNYVFDVLVPSGYDGDLDDLQHGIHSAVQHGDKPIHTVITFDQSYLPSTKNSSEQ